VAFVDFYSRVILSAQGRLNLADVLIDPNRPSVAKSLTETPELRRLGQPAPTSEGAANPASTAMPNPTATRTAKAAQAESPQPKVKIGTIRVAGGNVNFTDLFIRPNYTANLTQLQGSIDALASDRLEPSAVMINGRVDDDTPLEITGRIRPLTPTRFIDLRGVAKGFDLPKLSPYSARWAGYAIEKGKLTADVSYHIEGESLKADNKLTINQLTFGNKVESPDAFKVPVLLAVSLLKDRNGNIDLDLPISGTLSDPQFSVGGLIWRAIGNLIVKVVTSPFTLLSSLGSTAAADDLSLIEFDAGASDLDDEDRKRLDALASGLEQRPALSLEIAGYADPVSDRSALQHAQLDRALKGAKLGQLRRANRTGDLPSVDAVQIEPQERAALLEQLWRAAKLNPSTFAKAPSAREMEEQLLERTRIDSEDITRLAQARADTARTYLRETKGIEHERLYLLAPKLSDTSENLALRRVAFQIK
jgi:flagellar motor protein MotB